MALKPRSDSKARALTIALYAQGSPDNTEPPEPEAFADSRPRAYLSCPGLALPGSDRYKRSTFTFQRFLGYQVTQWD